VKVFYLLCRNFAAPDSARRDRSDHRWVRILLLPQSRSRDVLAIQREDRQDSCERAVTSGDQRVDHRHNLAGRLSAADSGCAETLKSGTTLRKPDSQSLPRCSHSSRVGRGAGFGCGRGVGVGGPGGGVGPQCGPHKNPSLYWVRVVT